MYVMHINILVFTYVNVQEKIMLLHYCVPPSRATARCGSCAWVKPVVHLRRGVPSKNHHDRVLSRKRHCVALNGGSIDFNARDRDPVVMKFFIKL
jgi:hypothetical protein